MMNIKDDSQSLEDYINSLIESNTTVVFTFGYTGSGKTCFFATMYEYLTTTYGTRTNFLHIGYMYIQGIANNIREFKKLPVSTTSGMVYDFDIVIERDKQEYMFTFVDMPGEDFSEIDPGYRKNKLTIEATLNEKIAAYLSNPELNIIVLCMIDYDNPERQDILVHNFFNYAQSHYSFKFDRVGLLISKWDKNTSNSPLQGFVKNNLKRTYNTLKSNLVSKMAAVFPLSIGETEGDKLKDAWNLQYCESISDWLCHNINNKIVIKDLPDQQELWSKEVLKQLGYVVKNNWKDIINGIKNFF